MFDHPDLQLLSMECQKLQIRDVPIPNLAFCDVGDQKTIYVLLLITLIKVCNVY